MTFFHSNIVRGKLWQGQKISSLKNAEPVPSVVQNSAYEISSFLDKGSNLGNWRWRIRNHYTATTTLNGYNQTSPSGPGIPFYLYRKVQSTGLDKTYVSTVLTGDSSVGVPPLNDPVSLSLTVVNNQALSTLLQQITNAQTAFQGGVFLGELKESIGMIRGRSRSFRSGLDSYLDTLKKRYRRTRSRKGRTTMVSETWLEYAFGWAPLLSDVNQGAKALSRIVTYDNPSQRVFAEASSTAKSEPVILTNNFGALSHKRVSSTSSTVSVRYHGEVTARFGSNYSIPTQLGLSFSQFVPTLWELIPYSFLVDYFTNIGSILNAFSLINTSVSWMEKGTCKETAVEVVPYSDTIQPPNSGERLITQFSIPGSTFSLKQRRITRENYVGSYVPGLVLKMPNSSTKFINLAGLFTKAKRIQRLLGN